MPRTAYRACLFQVALSYLVYLQRNRGSDVRRFLFVASLGRLMLRLGAMYRQSRAISWSLDCLNGVSDRGGWAGFPTGTKASFRLPRTSQWTSPAERIEVGQVVTPIDRCRKHRGSLLTQVRREKCRVTQNAWHISALSRLLRYY